MKFETREAKQRVLENLRKLQALWETVPPEAVNLDTYRNECGSLACLAGHACMSGQFDDIMKLVPRSSRWAMRGLHPFVLASSDFPAAETDLYPDLRFLDEHFGPHTEDLFDALDGPNSLDEIILQQVEESDEELEGWAKRNQHELARLRIGIQIQHVEDMEVEGEEQ